jgi:hypothetical protein
MNRAALGLRMHSGWGILVTVSGPAGSLELIDRRRIVITDSNTPMPNQPYHHAANLRFADAEKHIATCAAKSGQLALLSIKQLVEEMKQRQFRIVFAGILIGSGRPLPDLQKILAAHPLIHTAEGEFFRNAAESACEELKIPVTKISERDLEASAESTLGKAAPEVLRRIEKMRASVGPPWTKDHKCAALTAALLLA